MKLGKIACFLSALTVAFSFASCEGSGDDPVAKVELLHDDLTDPRGHHLL